MKYLIEKNVIIPVDKVTKEIEGKAVVYSWYTHEWEDIDIYDLENWKLAPIVRYLIEWWDIGGNKYLAWGIVWGLILLFGLWFWIYSWTEEKPVVTAPVQLVEKPIAKTEEKIEIIDNTENELKNEVEMMTGLKNEAELETLRNVFELEKKNINIAKLENSNSELFEKNTILKKELEILNEKVNNQVNRIINSPEDAFIYYLGDNVYQRCENANDEQILENCKDLYYKFIKYAENK